MKEYVDAQGHTYLYDEDDKLRPKGHKLVTTKPASTSDAAREAADAHKAAGAKANKAAPANSENK